ncbi:MAG: nucleotidyltransferase substrate binding protein, HI0074 family [uncultured bacterium]|nr:MAG: nucleotidyltransferase substrate binding protein, HI0074 family [uncultured bacterium]
MNQKRINQRIEDFKNALKRLDKVLKEDITKTDAIIDATIQRFEFTFELSWKLLKDILSYNGIEALNPRSTIKEAYQQKIIEDGDSWIQMLEDRNKTSHIYDEKEAKRIYDEIKNIYFGLLSNLSKNTKDIN